MKKNSRIFPILIILSVVIFFVAFLVKNNQITTVDNRPEHCMEDKCINSTVFSKLPPFPNNFSKALSENTLEVYYKQPEFYPTFETKGLNYYVNPPGDYLGFYGYGTYPSSERITAKQGDNKTLTTFFLTSWYVVSYQGLKFVLDNESLKEYFDIQIEPDTILLEPTYPVFEYNWTQKILIKIHVKDNALKGTYKIGINVESPPTDIENEWIERYRGYTSGGMFSIGKPFYVANVIVE